MALGVFWLRCLFALLSLALPANGVLQKISTEPTFNVFARTAHMMYVGKGETINLDCRTVPDEFSPDVHFYLIVCPMSVRTVDFSAHGTWLYGGDDIREVDGVLTTTVDLAVYEKSVLTQVYSCPDKETPSDGNCQMYNFDIYRSGGDIGTLDFLEVLSEGGARPLTPGFHSHNVKYELNITTGKPFTIEATAIEKDAVVGIEFLGASGESGLGKKNGCHLASRKHEVFQVDAIQGTGEYQYKVCAMAPDGIHRQDYLLKIAVVPDFSAKLEKLVPNIPEQYRLEPFFDPEIRTYSLVIPGEMKTIDFDIVAKDETAKLSFTLSGSALSVGDECNRDTEGSCNLMSCGKSRGPTNCTATKCICKKGYCAVNGKCEKPFFETAPYGSKNVKLKMNDNSHLAYDEAPDWSSSFTIFVHSADGVETKSYLVDIKQEVSTYAKLSDLTSEGCTLEPKFDPNHTEYECIWWWENTTNWAEREWAAFTPTMEMPGCAGCVIKLPDPAKNPTRHLSIFYQEERPDVWMKASDKPRMWNRTFLYGEWHTLNIEVFSADMWTRKTYSVYMERDCPIWMATRTTRAVSFWASRLALFLCLTSAVNFVALAKQLQFLDLVTDIEGIPKVFNEFADSIRNFNFDLTKLVDLTPIFHRFGVPTVSEVKEMVKKKMKKMTSKTGMSQAKLLVNYGFTKEVKGQREANILLARNKEDYETLKDEMATLEAKDPRRLGSNSSQTNATLRMLRGAAAEADLLDLHSDISGDFDDGRSLWEIASDSMPDSALARRLDDEEEEEVEMWYWGDEEWAKFEKGYEHVSKDTFPALNTKIRSVVKASISSVVAMHELHVFREMINDISGSFFVTCIMYMFIALIYCAFYWFCMRKRQQRFTITEPLELWLFLLDFGLINFARYSSKLMFDEKHVVSFFIFTPARQLVVMFCGLGLFFYPFLFVLGVLIAVAVLTTKQTLVFDEESGSWADKACQDLRIGIEPKSKVMSLPVIRQFTAQHLRSCVPIVDEEGEPKMFGDSVVNVLAGTIVRVKRNVPLTYEDGESGPEELPRNYIGYVQDSTEEGANVLFGFGDFTEPIKLDATQLKSLAIMYFHKGDFVKKGRGDENVGKGKMESSGIDEVMKGKVRDVIKNDKGVTIKVAFPKKEILEISGLELTCLKQLGAKKPKVPSKKQIRKQMAQQEQREENARERGDRQKADEEEAQAPKADYNEVDEILDLASRKKKMADKEKLNEDRQRKEQERDKNHEEVMKDLKAHAQAMCFVAGDPLRKGWAYFDLVLVKTPDDAKTLDGKEDKKGKEHGFTYTPVEMMAESSSQVLQLSADLQKDSAAEVFCQNNSLTIGKGAQIVSVNGVRIDAKKMTEELEQFNTGKQLKVRIRRARTAGKEHACASAPPWLFAPGTRGEGSMLEKVRREGDKGWNRVFPLGDFLDSFESVKNRDPEERLDPEERFAVLQYIKKAAIREKKLQRYNILNVACRDGFLKPQEPLKDTPKDGANVVDNDSIRWWLTKEEMDDRPDMRDKFGCHTKLWEYRWQNNYIESISGERLVYNGSIARPWSWWYYWLAPAGFKSGRMVWMTEPDEGWSKWEEKNGMKEGSTAHAEDAASSGGCCGGRGKKEYTVGGKRYADKWQWLMLEQWKREWEDDEATDESCYHWIPLYAAFRRFRTRQFREIVPETITKEEKIEMRQWLWAQMMITFDIKLKFAWAMMYHSKYYKGHSIEELAKLPFEQLIHDIEHAKPNDAVLLDHEKTQDNTHELLNFALMKFEDMYEEEPWMTQANEGELMLRLDSKAFFLTSVDESHKSRVEQNDLIPENGYFTSKAFNKYPEDKVGSKTFFLLKPNGVPTQFTVAVRLGHVMTLMRFLENFKLSVPNRNMEMPSRIQWMIVLGDKGKHEWYMYCVDRGTLLISIFVLATGTTGFWVGMTFLMMKTVSFLTVLHGQMLELYEEEEIEDETIEAQYIKVNSYEPEDEPEQGLEQLRQMLHKVGGSSMVGRFMINLLICTIKPVCLVLLLQVVTLILLCGAVGDYWPDPLMAIFVIAVSCINMIILNLSTLGSAIRKIVDAGVEYIQSATKLFNKMSTQTMLFLAGDNMLGIVFIRGSTESSAQDLSTAKSVDIAVPKLGLRFDGKADIDDTLPYDEQQELMLSKKNAYYWHRPDGPDDNRPLCVKTTDRYDDIKSSLTVALDENQLQHRKGVAEIVATLQCVNHLQSNLSQPAFDSFLTLFKPEDWDEEYDLDQDKVQDMLMGWEHEVDAWMKRELGAVATARTCTADIRNDIFARLKAECTQDAHRTVRKVLISSIKVPEIEEPRRFYQWALRMHGSKTALKNKLVSVMMLQEHEKAALNFPTDRASGYGRFQEVEEVSVQFEVTATPRAAAHGIDASEQKVDQTDPKSKSVWTISSIQDNSLMAQINKEQPEEQVVTPGDEIVYMILADQEKGFLTNMAILLVPSLEGAQEAYSPMAKLLTRIYPGFKRDDVPRKEKLDAKRGLLKLTIKKATLDKPFELELDMRNTTDAMWGFVMEDDKYVKKETKMENNKEVTKEVELSRLKIQALYEKGAIAAYNDSVGVAEMKDVPEGNEALAVADHEEKKPKIQAGDVIIDITTNQDATAPKPKNAEETKEKLLPEKGFEAKPQTLQVHRVAGISKHEGFEFKSKPAYSIKLDLAAAKNRAIMDSSCVGFKYIDGDGFFYHAWTVERRAFGMEDHRNEKPRTQKEQEKFEEEAERKGQVCEIYAIERNLSIKYHAQIETYVDVPVPLGCNNLRAAVWVQESGSTDEAEDPTKPETHQPLNPKAAGVKKKWEELVGFTSMLNVVDMCIKGFTPDVVLHTKFHEVAATSELVPWGGENYDKDDDDFVTFDRKDTAFARVWKNLKGNCMKAFRAAFPKRSKQEIMRTKGKLALQISNEPAMCFEAEEDDYYTQIAAKDICLGDSTMDSEKLDRHKDRWIELAKAFGTNGSVLLHEAELQEVRRHLGTMKSLRDTLKETHFLEDRGKLADELKVRKKLVGTMLRGSFKIVFDGPDANADFATSKEARHSLKGALSKHFDKLTTNKEPAKIVVNTIVAMDDIPYVKSRNADSGEEVFTKGDGVIVTFAADCLVNPWLVWDGESRKKPLESDLVKGVSRAISGWKNELGMEVTPQIVEAVLASDIDTSIERMEKYLAKIDKLTKYNTGRKVHPVPPRDLSHRKIGVRLLDLHADANANKGCCSCWRRIFFCFGRKNEPEETGLERFKIAMLKDLAKECDRQRLGSKAILHYSCLSDHLKPSKTWKPDNIPPHFANIVTAEFEDIPEVIVEGDNKKSAFTKVKFIRDCRPKTSTPALVNGRLVFKAQQEKEGVDILNGFPRWEFFPNALKVEKKDIMMEKKMTMGEAKAFASKNHKVAGWSFTSDTDKPADNDQVTVQFVSKFEIDGEKSAKSGYKAIRKNDVWLYWDGLSRWVISAHKGNPPPYGLKGQGADGFMWVQDPQAMAPDRITETWKRWNAAKKGTAGQAGVWEDDPAIKVSVDASLPAAKPDIIRMAELKQQEQEEEEGNQMCPCLCWAIGQVVSFVMVILDEIFGMLTSLFDTHNLPDPSTKDVLVSMNAQCIRFSWHDDNIERLAIFRRHLLNEFGSYQASWAFMTSNIKMPRSLARRNLAFMFHTAWTDLKKIEEQEKVKVSISRDCKRLKELLRDFQNELQAALKKDNALAKMATLSKHMDNDIRTEKVNRLMTQWGWMEGTFPESSDMLHQDKERRDDAFERLNKAIDKVEEAQGKIVDLLSFDVEFEFKSSLKTRDDLDNFKNKWSEFDKNMKEHMKAVQVRIGDPTWQARFSIEMVGDAAASVSVPEEHLKKVVEDQYNVAAAAIQVTRTTLSKGSTLDVVISALDPDVADRIRAITLNQGGKKAAAPKFWAVATVHALYEEAGPVKGRDEVVRYMRSPKGVDHLKAVGGEDLKIECIQECRDLEKLTKIEKAKAKGVPSEGDGKKMESTGSVASTATFMSESMKNLSQDLDVDERMALKNFLSQNVDALNALNEASKKKDDKALQQLKEKEGKKNAQKSKVGPGKHIMTLEERKRAEAQEAKRQEELRFEALAAHIVDRMDRDRSGSIDVTELNSLYEEDTKLSERYLQFQCQLTPFDQLSKYLNDESRTAFINEVKLVFLKTLAGGEPKDKIEKRFSGYSFNFIDDDEDLYLVATFVPGKACSDVSKLNEEIKAKLPEFTQELEKALQVSKPWNDAIQAIMDETPGDEDEGGQPKRKEKRWHVSITEPEDSTVMMPDMLLERFRVFLSKHPYWKKFENMWADLSEDVEVGMADFSNALQGSMHKVIDPQFAGKAPEAKAKAIFALMDSQISDGISLKELIPSSGSRYDDADKAFISLDVPLAHLKEVRLEGAKKGTDDKYAIRFVLNPANDDTSREWAKLRTALNPEWQVSHGNETLQVCMTQRYYDLWRQVIRESGMTAAQEFIRHYDGEFEEHPSLGGVYMRSGKGVQYWADGKVYTGAWRDHLYEGPGKLFGSIAEYENGVNPIYDGTFKHGKRHGAGILRWEQDIMDRAQGDFRVKSHFVGVTKTYNGQFKDDLFHGEGVLKVERAVPQTVTLRAPTTETRRGVAPPAQVQPSQLLMFKGLFSSDWDQTDYMLRDVDPIYDSKYDELRIKEGDGGSGAGHGQGRIRDSTALARAVTERVGRLKRLGSRMNAGRSDGYSRLESQTTTKKGMSIGVKELSLARISRKEAVMRQGLGSKKFEKYFSMDPKTNTQSCGPALPDLALSAYSLHSCRHDSEGEGVGFDALHFKQGHAEYADDTVYDGDFLDGVPHGHGTMKQYVSYGKGGKQVLATYEGQFEQGMRWGIGTYKVYQFNKDGMPFQSWRAIDAKTKEQENSKLATTSFGIVLQKEKTKTAEILKHSDIGDKTYQQYCVENNLLIVEWGTTVDGVVEHDSKTDSDWLNVLDGQFYVAIKLGKTEYLQRAPEEDGVIYQGEWEENRRTGRGRQMVPFHLREEFGYWSYDGMWQKDKRKGNGEMQYGERGEFLYVGPFHNDMREGRSGEEVLISGYDMQGTLSAEVMQGRKSVTKILDNTLNFGKIYSMEMPKKGRPPLLHEVGDTNGLGIAFGRFSTSPGEISGIDPKDEGEEMTLQEAMLKCVTIEGCCGFVVEKEDVWVKLPQPLSHSSIRGWDVKMKVRFATPSGGVFKKTNTDSSKTTFWRAADCEMLLHARFMGDEVAGENGWSYVPTPGSEKYEGKFYFGQFDKEGRRSGVGTMYDSLIFDTEDKTAFRQAIETGKVFTSAVIPPPKDWKVTAQNFQSFKFDNFIKDFIETDNAQKLKGIAYWGQWSADKPSGVGVQHYTGDEQHCGTYMGQFKDGKRDGMGVYVKNDAKWKYTPRSDLKTPNWCEDTMHGIGTVEDPKTVHENVVYAKGKTKMPFLEFGPPTSGFDVTTGFSSVMKRAKKGRVPHPISTVNPATTTAEKDEKALMKGWSKKESALPASTQDLGVDIDQAFVREPTDLASSDFDVRISGGTGENEVLNGIYFKLGETYGVPTYRLVKRETWITTHSFQRYLYQDAKMGAWIISSRSSGGITIAPGCAFSQDAEARHPTEITTPWYIWRKVANSLQCPEDIEQEEKNLIRIIDPKEKEAAELKLKDNPLDKLKIESIIGLNVKKASGNLSNGMMLRVQGEFYGRPVYELDGCEATSQFLYWMQANGSAEDEAARGPWSDSVAKLFAKGGKWIFSTKVGDSADNCIAYVEDMAMLPCDITGDWMVKSGSSYTSASVEITAEVDDGDGQGFLTNQVSKAASGAPPESNTLLS